MAFLSVIPAQAGTQCFLKRILDSRFHGDDNKNSSHSSGRGAKARIVRLRGR